MDKLICMNAFINVVETGGFSSAGRKLGISKTLISKYVAQLEDVLGVLLLQRNTRRVTTTEVGYAYYQRCLPLLEEVDELESMVRLTHMKPAGNLVLGAPTSFSELHLMPVLSEFTRSYPDVKIDLRLTDRFVDIVEDGIDIAIRIGNLEDSSLIARKIAPIRLITCASPQYLEQAAPLTHHQDLKLHRCIIDSNYSIGGHWSFQKNGQQILVDVNASIKVNSVRAVRELLLSGCGLSVCPLFAVSDDIRHNRLIHVLNSYETVQLGLYAVYSHRRHLSAKVRVFVDYLIEHFSLTPPWNYEPGSVSDL